MPSDDSNERKGNPTDDRSPFGRRTYLKTAASAIALGGLATSGVVNNASAATTRHGITFDRTVDAVNDLGMDPTGSDPIDSALEDALSDGTLIEFPEGDYLVTSRHVVTSGTYGLLGTGDARFVLPSGYNSFFLISGNNTPADEVLFENIDVDITASDAAAGLKLYTKYGFHVQDVQYHGRGIHSDSDVVNAFSVGVRQSGNTGVMKNCVAKKGSAWARYKAGDGRTGIGVYGPHSGTVRIVDCDLREFGNNSLYASRHPGNVQVEGGFFQNNNASHVRIHGEGSYVDGAVIEIDPDKYTGPREPDFEDGAFALRGVVLEQKLDDASKSKPAGVEVRNCDIVVKNNPSGVSPAIQSKYTGKTLTVRNTRIEHDVDGQPAVRRDPQYSGQARDPSGDPRWLKLDGVSITGDASNSATVLIGDADDSVVKKSCLQQAGTDRNGLKFVDSGNCSVDDTNLNVTGSPIVSSGSSVSTSNVTTGDTCPVPDTSGGDSGSGSTDTSVAVSTGSASNVGTSSATLSGDLADLGGASSADVYFEWGTAGGSLPNATAPQTLTSTGRITETVKGLSGSTDYEFRVVAEASDGDTDTGSTGTFTTDGDALGNVLTLQGGSASDRVDYTFTVSGDVTKSDANGASINDNDVISASTADGWLGGGKDSYEFSGDVTDFAADGDVTITLNGTEVTEEELVSLPNTLSIQGGSASNVVPYEFTVSEDLQKGGYANDNDTVSGSTASGQVAGGIDTYEFSGQLETFTADEDVLVEINGQEVDESNYAPLAHSITIDGDTSYELTVSGDLQAGDGADAGDVSGSTATSSVSGGSDTYEFDGRVVEFVHDGTATITLDGTSFPASEWLNVPNPVVFDGTGNYSLSASADLARDPATAPVDGSATVDGTSANGTLDGGTDAFRYAGELEDLSVDPGVSVRLSDRD